MEDIDYLFIAFLLNKRLTLDEAITLPPDLKAEVYPIFLKELSKYM
jgi:hypothetical protein